MQYKITYLLRNDQNHKLEIANKPSPVECTSIVEVLRHVASCLPEGIFGYKTVGIYIEEAASEG